MIPTFGRGFYLGRGDLSGSVGNSGGNSGGDSGGNSGGNSDRNSGRNSDRCWYIVCAGVISCQFRLQGRSVLFRFQYPGQSDLYWFRCHGQSDLCRFWLYGQSDLSRFWYRDWSNLSRFWLRFRNADSARVLGSESVYCITHPFREQRCFLVPRSPFAISFSSSLFSIVPLTSGRDLSFSSIRPVFRQAYQSYVPLCLWPRLANSVPILLVASSH